PHSTQAVLAASIVPARVHSCKLTRHSVQLEANQPGARATGCTPSVSGEHTCQRRTRFPLPISICCVNTTRQRSATPSSSSTCAHGYPQILHINVPVHVGGVTLHPGDLLHGDCNGVTTIPNEVASATAHACAEYVAAEGVIFEYLKAGKPDVPGFTKARKECG